MPFTFSHPAAVLPLKYLPAGFYSLTGLIVGSMTPDFEYFIRMTVGSIYSHTLGGLFYFDLPVGMAICFLFHDVVRNGLIEHLPMKIRQRFWDLKIFNWNNAFRTHWPVIAISILVGAASHILWDDFTHPLGYFVLKSGFLRHRIQIAGQGIPVYNLLQSLSSLIGGIVVLIFIWKLPASKTKTRSEKDFYWLIVFSIVFIVMFLRILTGLMLAKYGNVVVSLISAFFIAIILTPLFYRHQTAES